MKPSDLSLELHCGEQYRRACDGKNSIPTPQRTQFPLSFGMA
jgi:hypothetical protein